MLGRIIECCSGPVGTPNAMPYIRVEDSDLKVKRVTLDSYHSSLPCQKGDIVIVSKNNKLLIISPTDSDYIKTKINESLTDISPIFTRLIFKKAEDYISRENFSPSTSKNKVLSSFFNSVCWKDHYDKTDKLYELLGKVVPKPDCKKFTTYWIKNHLFRQLSLWGLTDPMIEILIEDLAIANMGNLTDIEDFMSILSKYPGRFMSIHPDINDDAISHIEDLFDADPTPAAIASIKKQIRRNKYDSYIPFTPSHLLSLGSKKSLLSQYGLTIFDNNTKVSLSSTYKLEEYVSKVIISKINKSNYDWIDYPDFNPNTCLKDLSEDQRKSVKMVFSNQISIITGGPGTGKTKVIHSIIKEAISRGIKYHVAAFTGKAVGRVKETAHPDSIESSTLDMMFARGSKFYDFNLLILEEASMITTKYMYRLFQKFPPFMYQIVLVGDLNQIPPIERGHFFSSLLWSKRVPYMRLDHNFRVDQKYGGDIVRNASRIVDPLRNLALPIELDIESTSFNIFKGGIDLLRNTLMKIDKSLLNKMTILTPYNNEVNIINKIFQGIKYGTDSKYFNGSFCRWYEKDRIMVIENDTSTDIANGDLGYISELRTDDTIEICLDKDDSKRVFSVKDCDKKLKHSYCFTINKSQGSEYDTVILFLPINTANEFFLNLNLLYTAITRSKKMVWIIVEDISILIKACNTRLPVSNDFLKHNIISKFPNKEYTGTLVERVIHDDYDDDDEYD